MLSSSGLAHNRAFMPPMREGGGEVFSDHSARGMKHLDKIRFLYCHLSYLNLNAS